jgi:hypothetical protein
MQTLLGVPKLLLEDARQSVKGKAPALIHHQDIICGVAFVVSEK